MVAARGRVRPTETVRGGVRPTETQRLGVTPTRGGHLPERERGGERESRAGPTAGPGRGGRGDFPFFYFSNSFV